jgi:hypothetical protein
MTIEFLTHVLIILYWWGCVFASALWAYALIAKRKSRDAATWLWATRGVNLVLILACMAIQLSEAIGSADAHAVLFAGVVITFSTIWINEPPPARLPEGRSNRSIVE